MLSASALLKSHSFEALAGYAFWFLLGNKNTEGRGGCQDRSPHDVFLGGPNPRPPNSQMILEGQTGSGAKCQKSILKVFMS